ncbi:MAG TPA: hypothetical protein VGD91_18420, partial [Trebonia sp.]
MKTGRVRWRALAAAGAAVTACGITAACGGSGLAGAPPGPAASVSAGPAAGGAPTTGSPAVACVAQVLGGLSLAQRVGQLFLVGVNGDAAGPELTAAARTYHFGSLLLNSSAAGTAALAARTAAMQKLAAAGTGGVPFFIAANQEGGQIQQLTGPGFSVMPSAVV